MYSVIGCGNMILWKPSSVSHFITYCNSVIHHFVTKLRWFIIHSISRFGLELLAHRDSLSYDSNKNNRQTDKHPNNPLNEHHYCDVVMGVIASQITSLAIVYSTVYSDSIGQRKHQSSASLAFVRGIHRWPVNSPHKWPVTRKMLPFDDVIMFLQISPKFWQVSTASKHR